MRKFIPCYGDRLAAVDFARRKKKETAEHSTSSLLERLRRKIGRKRKCNNSGPSTYPTGNVNALKQNRRIELGWMDFDHSTKEFRQVRSNSGGGTRQLKVKKEYGVNKLLELSTALFFPGGTSKRGRQEEFDLSMQDFRGCELGEATVGELYETTSVKMLRLYLCSKKRDQPEPDNQDEVKLVEEERNSRPTSPSSLDSTIPYGAEATKEDVIVVDSSSSDTEILSEISVEIQPSRPSDTEILPETVVEINDPGNLSDELPQISLTQQEIQPSSSNSPPNNNQIDTAHTWPKDSHCNIRLHRCNVQAEMIAIFKTPEIISQPLKVTFVDEAGVDAQGVSREAYTAFWQSFFETSADGEYYRIPSLNPHYGLEEWQAIGRILAKGLRDHDVFPLQMAPAFFQALVFGEESISPEDLTDSFLRFLSDVDSAAVRAAMAGHLSDDEKEIFEDLLDREGSHTIPEDDQVLPVIRQLAHKCMVQNSSYALQAMGGIVRDALANSFPSVQSIKNLYDRCKPTPKKVCDLFVANPMTKEQSQSLRYLMQFVRAQDDEGLGKLLRYMTSSCIMSVKSMTIEFRDMSGIARRPIAHTCGPVLELPSTYASYREFRSKWQSVLSSGYLSMDFA